MKKVIQVWPYVLNAIETVNVDETYFFDFNDSKDEKNVAAAVSL